MKVKTVLSYPVSKQDAVNPYRIDTSDFPMVLMVIAGDITPEQLKEHLVEYRALLDRGEKYSVVYDASSVGKVDAYTRKAYADFMIENKDDLHHLCVGLAFVITSALARGALTAVLWVTGGLPFPHKTFANTDTATEWAYKKIMSAAPDAIV